MATTTYEAQTICNTGPKANDTFDYSMKILIIGDSTVGKTCLLLRFCDDNFTPSFITTIGIDFRIRRMTIDDKKVKVQIWDTAGQERFRTITTAYYRGAHGILLVYDTTNRITFNNVSNWIKQLKYHSDGNIKIILVGNKCDLEDIRQVSYEEGLEKANSLGCAYFETSAKSGLNVESSFLYLINTVHNNLNEDIPPLSVLNENLTLKVPVSSPSTCCLSGNITPI